MSCPRAMWVFTCLLICSLTLGCADSHRKQSAVDAASKTLSAEQYGLIVKTLERLKSVMRGEDPALHAELCSHGDIEGNLAQYRIMNDMYDAIAARRHLQGRDVTEDDQIAIVGVALVLQGVYTVCPDKSHRRTPEECMVWTNGIFGSVSMDDGYAMVHALTNGIMRTKPNFFIKTKCDASCEWGRTRPYPIPVGVRP